MSNKWILQHGIHRHTLTSRDSGEDEKFKTREAAVEELAKIKQYLKKFGYVIWYAYLIDPEGNRTLLEENSYY